MNARTVIEGLLETIERPPERNCSCHIAPPCSDCVEYEGLRDAIRDAEAWVRSGADPDKKVEDLEGKITDLKEQHRKEIQEMQKDFREELRDAVAEARYEASGGHGF